jgi:hypothetical protein
MGWAMNSPRAGSKLDMAATTDGDKEIRSAADM